MPNPCLPERGGDAGVPLTSHEEVLLDWLSAGLAKDGGLAFDPFLARVADLGLARGNHYHVHTGSRVGPVGMLTFDWNMPNSAVRHSIITAGKEVHHYLFEIATSRVVGITGTVKVNKAGENVIDIMTPPIISRPKRESRKLNVAVGRAYQGLVLDYIKSFGTDAPGGSTERATEEFLQDTNRFACEEAVTHMNRVPVDIIPHGTFNPELH